MQRLLPYCTCSGFTHYTSNASSQKRKTRNSWGAFKLIRRAVNAILFCKHARFFEHKFSSVKRGRFTMRERAWNVLHPHMPERNETPKYKTDGTTFSKRNERPIHMCASFSFGLTKLRALTRACERLLSVQDMHVLPHALSFVPCECLARS